MKKQLRKTGLLGGMALSATCIAVPTVLTSCSKGPKYTIEWSTQIFENITPYIPEVGQQNKIDAAQAGKLWMDNLTDKQKTLDIFSFPMLLADQNIPDFINLNNITSPFAIEVYKSEFKQIKNVNVYDYSKDKFIKSDLTTWSLNLKFKFTPAILTDGILSLIQKDNEDEDLKEYIEEVSKWLSGLYIDAISFKVDKLPFMYGFSQNENLSINISEILSSFPNANSPVSYDYVQLSSPFKTYVGDGMLPISCSLTDSVNTSDAKISLHIVAPYEKTLDINLSGAAIYGMFNYILELGNGYLPSYYLSKLDIPPVSN